MPFKTGSVRKGTPSGKLSSIYSLLQSLQTVNENSDTDGNTLTEAQQEHFKDSKVRDENGRLKVMYHGTPNATYNAFRSGTYFTRILYEMGQWCTIKQERSS